MSYKHYRKQRKNKSYNRTKRDPRAVIEAMRTLFKVIEVQIILEDFLKILNFKYG